METTRNRNKTEAEGDQQLQKEKPNPNQTSQTQKPAESKEKTAESTNSETNPKSSKPDYQDRFLFNEGPSIFSQVTNNCDLTLCFLFILILAVLLGAAIFLERDNFNSPNGIKRKGHTIVVNNLTNFLNNPIPNN